MHFIQFSKEQTLKLIELYEQRPVLWNSGNGLAGQDVLCRKQQALEEVASFLNCSTLEVSRKWRSLKSSYRRERNRLRTEQRSDSSSPKWFAYAAMSFLLQRNGGCFPENEEITDHEDTHASIEGEDGAFHMPLTEVGSVYKTESATPQTSEMPLDPNQESDQPMLGNCYPSSSDINAETEACNGRKARKRSLPGDDEKMDKVLEVLRHVALRSQDESSIYGQHVGNKLRGYSNKTKAIVQHYMNSILYQADMGRFEASPFVEGPRVFYPTTGGNINMENPTRFHPPPRTVWNNSLDDRGRFRSST